MIRWAIGAAAAILIAFGAVWALAIRRAAQSAVKQLGAPTPDEARIETQTEKTAGQLAEQGAARAQEVTNADRQALLALARKRWFPGLRK